MHSLLKQLGCPLLVQAQQANVLGHLRVCAHLLVSMQVLVCKVARQDMGLLLFPVELQVYHLADISRWHPDVLQDDGCLDVASGLQEAIPSTWKLRGIRALQSGLKYSSLNCLGRRIKVGVCRHIGTMRSLSNTLMSRQPRIFWSTCCTLIFINLGSCL